MSTEVKNQFEILRLHKGSKSHEDWKDTGEIGINDINTIQDPEGATAEKEITSIPSPFARIHLFEQAFEFVSDQAHDDISQLDKNTVYHKLVSDSLDVGEVFFNYDQFNKAYKGMNVVRWNKQAQIKSLRESHYEGHELLGETLDLFLKQDGKTSNFDRMKNLHFLFVDHDLIGGTSPSTLFFSSSNSLDHLDLRRGDDILFDRIFTPLYKRSKSYQRYLYGLFTAHKDLRTLMGRFWKYLEVSLGKLKTHDRSIYNEIKELENSYTLEMFLQEFTRLENDDVIDIFPGVNGKISIEHLREDAGVEKKNSDFFIKSKKYKGDHRPMVLQNGDQRNFTYFGTKKWDPEIEVPYYDPKPISERLLPELRSHYPYLTVSDFLEPTLIKLPYAIDRSRFFDGNPNGFELGNKTTETPPDESYLLPIKREYFEYFDIPDLKSRSNDNRPIFSMTKVGLDSVRVQLRIPIGERNDYVVFERIYTEEQDYEEVKNEGAIVNLRFSMGFIPFIKANALVEQRVGLIDADVASASDRNSQYSLSFINVTDSGLKNVIPAQETVRSNLAKGHSHNATSKYCVLKEDYELVEVLKPNGVKGILIPEFYNNSSGSKDFTFAIDFGTTNTHIEYCEGAGNPQSFNIGEKRSQLVTLFDPDWGASLPQLEALLLRETIPYEIGTSNSRDRFPLRTATSEIEGLNHQQATFALGDINIPFAFEKEAQMPSEVIQTNLKWSKLKGDDSQTSRNRVEGFIETLLILIRNKVVSEGGNLSKTKLIWFYPASMSVNNINQYRKIWSKLYQKYFNQNDEPIDYSESEAPFYNYDSNKVQSEKYPVINVDIGGGTTDIVVFENNKPKFLTSVKFAGNSVFGDAYSNEISYGNGFVTICLPTVQTFLENNNSGLHGLWQVFQQMTSQGRTDSSDMMAFLFSLEKNTTIKGKNLNINVSEVISNHEEMNIILLVFYGAIVYHIASLMHKLGLKMPRNICLSGNGSRIIRLLDSDKKLKGISKLSQLIFERIYEEEYHQAGLTMISGNDPKEATCKGGIKKNRSYHETPEIGKLILLGDLENSVINTKGDTFPKKSIKYEELDQPYKDSVLAGVQDFLDILFSINDDFSFEDHFGIKIASLEDHKAYLKQDLDSFLEKGMNQRLAISSANSVVEESLFFYPLIGALYQLGQRITSGDE